MNYLVTGGAGFIGSHLCEFLVNNGNNVIAVDDLSSGFESNLIKHGSLKLIVNKLQNLSINSFANIHGIFHLAAQASVPVSMENFYESSLNNVQTTLWVFELSRKLNIPVVFASSSALYGNMPVGNDKNNKFDIISPYAMDKLISEQYANLCNQIYEVNSVGLRFFNVYGPKQDPKSPYSGVISIFLDRFINKQEVTINGGYQTRDFIYVTDIVNTLISSMQLLFNKKKNIFINVGTGISITINELYNMLSKIFNYKPKIKYQPLDPSDPERSDGIFELLKEELNIDNKQFINIEDGLRKTVDYYLKQN